METTARRTLLFFVLFSLLGEKYLLLHRRPLYATRYATTPVAHRIARTVFLPSYLTPKIKRRRQQNSNQTCPVESDTYNEQSGVELLVNLDVSIKFLSVGDVSFTVGSIAFVHRSFDRFNAIRHDIAGHENMSHMKPVVERMKDEDRSRRGRKFATCKHIRMIEL